MNVTVNGEARAFRDGMSVRDVIEELGLFDGPVAVEINREIVPRAEHATRLVHDGDALEIVHFVGGG